eukprot:CAMPEP_0196599156 /NCGR_PEP_ID=MMETSP1081-20130531/94709_1 /TAXON_ID=36882 /ORGANISM="Pyramimonas amylifera, Strain CCMP720" /LENGTH=1065 /DNA_ID=CAMNT_0041924911 /DNA_START=31 /DNA_END=3229 /DNA_ORIENTATION=+
MDNSLPSKDKLFELMDRENHFERSELGPEGAIKLLQTSLETGISNNEATLRLKKYGTNYVQRSDPDTFWEVMLNNANDKVIIMIALAGVMAMGVDALEGDDLWYVDGGVTLITLAMVIVFSSAFEYFRERKFLLLMKKVDDYKVVVRRSGEFVSINAQGAAWGTLLMKKVDDYKVVVRRSGEFVSINAQGVCVGDLVYLETGDVPPGDGILVDAGPIDINESSLTGESETREKVTFGGDSAVYAGTNVAGGSGMMVVLCTGENSVAGQVAQTLEEDEEGEVTGLEARLGDMADMIGYWALVSASFFFVFVVVEYFLLVAAGLQDTDNGSNIMSDVFDLFVCALLLLILGIPEGLPVAISLTLVLGAKKMEEENVLVKKPKKGEIMGTVTTICTDKTGTLTTGVMTVQELVVGDQVYASDISSPRLRSISPTVRHHLALGVALNSTSRVSTFSIPLSFAQESGNNTERALLRILDDSFGMDYIAQRAKHNILWNAPFSSTRKVSSVIVCVENRQILYCKGAPEVVLSLCSRYINTEGVESNLSQEMSEDILQVIAGKEMRAVAMAYRELPATLVSASLPRGDPFKAGDPVGSPEADLCLLGVALIRDPVREDIKSSLQTCKAAGVNVIMVTGDSASTATSVALQCGLLDPDFLRGAVMEGPKFRRLVMQHSQVFPPEAIATPKSAPQVEDSPGPAQTFNQGAFDRLWPKLRVLARSSPIDKYLLVKGLCNSKLYQSGRPDIHSDKQIVAVTGDGVNDIAAMRRAHVGVAMGGGQQAAIEAAEVVLTDDNFSSCVTGLKWGRNIREAAQKFIQFQITITLVFCFFLFIQVVLFMNTAPLSLMQALWLNLVQDTLGAVTLASDAAGRHLLKRGPVKEDEPLVSPMMKRNIIAQTLFQTLFIFIFGIFADSIFTFDGASDEGDDFCNTVTFHLIVFQTLANQFCMRKVYGEYNFLEGLGRNPWFVAVAGLEFLLQLLIAFSGGPFTEVTIQVDTLITLLFIAFGGVWTFQTLMNAAYWYWRTGVSFTYDSFMDLKAPADKQSLLKKEGSDEYGTFSANDILVDDDPCLA